MIRERQRNKLDYAVHLAPCDRLICDVTDKDGQTQRFTEEIGRTIVVDTVVTFDVKDEFGLEDGIGAVFGKNAN
jgi:hypothetical protein